MKVTVVMGLKALKLIVLIVDARMQVIVITKDLDLQLKIQLKLQHNAQAQNAFKTVQFLT